jgi:hypothetical protein
VTMVHAILEIFVGASGLRTNVSKCQLIPICCSPDQIVLVQHLFPCQLAHFPCKYLGIPLSIFKLTKAELQPLVNSVADHLPMWKARLMSRAGRTTLVKSTLSAVLVHTAIGISVPRRSIVQLTSFGEIPYGRAPTRCVVAAVSSAGQKSLALLSWEAWACLT